MTAKTHFKITVSQIAHLNRADYNYNLFAGLKSFMPFPLSYMYMQLHDGCCILLPFFEFFSGFFT